MGIHKEMVWRIGNSPVAYEWMLDWAEKFIASSLLALHQLHSRRSWTGSPVRPLVCGSPRQSPPQCQR